MELKLRGVLSAKQVCLLAFWADRAGACGVGHLGLGPNKQSGKYSRHFDEALGSSESAEDLYRVTLSKRSKVGSTRWLGEVPVRPPHEALLPELSDPSGPATAALKDALASGVLPRAYIENPIVRAAPKGCLVHPVCFYLDGVAFTRTDSILGLWCYCLLGGERHLLAAIRKSGMSSCGCRGWDTIYPLMLMLRSSFNAMGKGVFPSTRHDGTTFGEGDSGRSSLSGQPLGYRAVCLFVKGDWAEYNHTLGMPPCSDKTAPCPLCMASSSDRFCTDELSRLGTGHELMDFNAYNAACSDCEKHVLVEASDHRRLRAALAYDRRQAGARGRALQADFPHLNLFRNDRLEPSIRFPDGSAFVEATPPLQTSWWRSVPGARVRRRNPLFCPETGLGPQSLCVDALHTLSLGVYQFFVSHLLWEILRANHWGLKGSARAVAELGFGRLREAYGAWCTAEQRAGRSVSKAQGFCFAMLGASDDPELKLRAAETNTMLRFSEAVFPRHAGVLEPARRRHFESGLAALMAMHRVTHEARQTVPPNSVQQFTDATRRHLKACVALGIRLRPKHHFMLHMGPRRA